MDRTTTAPSTSALLALRAAIIVHLGALLWEAVTAGQLVAFNMDALPLHYFGAFAVHAAAGLQVLAAAWLWFSTGRGPGTARLVLLVSLVALPVGFVQAATGTFQVDEVHVPLATALVGLVVWTAVLAWRRR